MQDLGESAGLNVGKISPRCKAWLVAERRSVVAEFTIFGQSQAPRALLSLPCLCDQGVHTQPGRSTDSFILKQDPYSREQQAKCRTNRVSIRVSYGNERENVGGGNVRIFGRISSADQAS